MFSMTTNTFLLEMKKAHEISRAVRAFVCVVLDLFYISLVVCSIYAMEDLLPVEKSCVFPFRQEKTSQNESVRLFFTPPTGLEPVTP